MVRQGWFVLLRLWNSGRIDRQSRTGFHDATYCQILTVGQSQLVMIGERTPNPDLPPLVATAFLEAMRDRGFSLDYSESSLTGSLDEILDLSIFRDPEAETVSCSGHAAAFDLKSAASAYLGETLARLHDGSWTGWFDHQSSVNFYTAVVSFGEYRLFPIRWLSYRVSHGREEGSVTDWLHRVLPSIKARENLTSKTGFIKDIY